MSRIFGFTRCVCVNVASNLVKQRSAFDSNTVRAYSHYFRNSPNSEINSMVLSRYHKLEIRDKRIQATYLWVDGSGENLRLKNRVFDRPATCVADLPNWHGSSKFQDPTGCTEFTLAPRAMYRDPFKSGRNDLIVMCETYKPDGTPTKSNKRARCQEVMTKVEKFEPWFGIEQEYTLLTMTGRPFGWPEYGGPEFEGSNYCTLGADRIYARELAEAHAKACLYAGLNYTGNNSEVMPAQWEYQVGPCAGIILGDDLWVSRYILYRIAEELGIRISFDPMPMGRKAYGGAGAHVNFSTNEMRQPGGVRAIEKAISKLSQHHKRHLRAYDPQGGKANARRLSGQYETSNIDHFSWGIENRGASVRMPRSVMRAGRGFLEDRRPGANCDPYSVMEAMVKTCLLT